MKIQDLQPLPKHHIPANTSFFRVQWIRKRPNTVVTSGGLKLPPPGAMTGRFDLPGESVAYGCGTELTALYETDFRREVVTGVSIQRLAQRELVCFHSTDAMSVADLRVHAPRFPVLASLRYSETQELAHEIWSNGYSGIVYSSAQQPGADCFVFFPQVLALLKVWSSAPLVNPANGAFHVSVGRAHDGSRIPVIP